MFDHSLLKEEIIERSFCKNWKDAKKEWRIEYSYDSTDPTDIERCLCGFTPLTECHVIKNFRNKNEAVVGNICARKFIDFSKYDPMWVTFYNLQQNPGKPLNLMAAGFAFDKSWINEVEYDFSTDTCDKAFESLSESDKKIRVDINKNVAAFFLNFYFTK